MGAGLCAPYYLKSKPIVGRCIPEGLADIAGKVLEADGQTIVDALGEAVNSTMLADTKWIEYLLNIQSYGSKVLADIQKTWSLILLLLALAAVWAFIWIVLM